VERHPLKHPHLEHGAGELLNAVPARVVDLPAAQPRQELALLAEVLEQRAAAQQHPLVERVLQIRALQSRCLAEPVQIALHACEDLVDRLGAEHAISELPQLPSAERVVQIPLIAEQVADRGDRPSVVVVRAAQRLNPLVAIPAPERQPVRAGAAHQQRPGH
jgi:hypothetical protein